MTKTDHTFLIPAPVEFVIDRLESCGYHAYCVGGCVRDHLMGRTPGDYDVTTSAKPDDMLRVFSECRIVETGLKHGTVTVVRDGMNIEVTTYRIDGTYDDGRHPDSVTFTDKLSDDLCRRDFTINAMAHSPVRGIVDIFGGKDDLAARKIRCVGCAADRFSEDGLRIMRALRFSSVLDFTPDEECAAAVLDLTHLLDKISRERIYVELTKLLCGVGAARILREFPSVIAHVLPNVSESDVIRASMAIENDAVFYPDLAPSAAVRYAAIFDSLTDKEAADAINSLKPSRAEKSAILLCRRSCPSPDEAEIKKLMSKTDDETPSILARYSCIMGKITPDEAHRIEAAADEIIKKDEPRRLSMLEISGSDLQNYGFTGRAIGEKLNEILELIIDGKLDNTKENIELYLKK